MNEDLSALVFELQRARSPVEKARAMARAWRTIRNLDRSERRLLVREVGFEGAEELIEGLAGRGRGVFAPAAVLEALGRARRDPDLSVLGVLDDLRDPDRRDDLLVRGIDLVADSVAAPAVPPEGPSDSIDESAIHDQALELEDENLDRRAAIDFFDDEERLPPVPEPASRSEPEPGSDPEPVAELDPEPEPQPDPEPDSDREPEPPTEPEIGPEPGPEPAGPSPWDSLWRGGGQVEPEPLPTVSLVGGVGPDQTRTAAAGSVLDRLRAFRRTIPSLRDASLDQIRAALDGFPEPWARRRALVSLLESGIPAPASEALALIEDLERPMDRRWCLTALARRGDLSGDALERALGMLSSFASRRRVQALARSRH